MRAHALTTVLFIQGCTQKGIDPIVVQKEELTIPQYLAHGRRGIARYRSTLDRGQGAVYLFHLMFACVGALRSRRLQHLVASVGNNVFDIHRLVFAGSPMGTVDEDDVQVCCSGSILVEVSYLRGRNKP